MEQISLEERKTQNGKIFAVKVGDAPGKEVVLTLVNKTIRFSGQSEKFTDGKGRPKISVTQELGTKADELMTKLYTDIKSKLPKDEQEKAKIPIMRKRGRQPTLKLDVTYDGDDKTLNMCVDGKSGILIEKFGKTFKWGTSGNFTIHIKDVFCSGFGTFIRTYLRSAAKLQLVEKYDSLMSV